MDIDDPAIAELAANHGFTGAALRAVVEALSAQAGTRWFYVFWISGGGGGAGSSGTRQRTVVAFTTPDAALAFAQHNRIDGKAAGTRLRRIGLHSLVVALLREPSIVRLLLAHDFDEPPPVGQYPPGITIERADLITRLREYG